MSKANQIMTHFSAVILAAGKGTRMYSDLPKVLHTLAGKPMIKHVIDTCYRLEAQQVNLVYGHGGELMQKALCAEKLNWVLQAEQLGTGHAVNQSAAYFSDDEQVLVLYGDVPLISEQTLTNLLKAQPEGGIALLTVHLEEPKGYGRILRQDGSVVAIVEEKDATDTEKKIGEVNTGVMVAKGKDLRRWLSQLTNDNAQGEYYLTDIISIAYNEGRAIEVVHPISAIEVEGVNNRVQLARLERAFQLEQAQTLLTKGVMLRDPARFDLRGELDCGQDVEIDVNVIIEGKVVLGDRVQVGAGCILKDCEIGDDSVIAPYTLIDGANVSSSCQLGPFARLRPGSDIRQGARVGNFVETKNTLLGQNSKANHLTYLGDALIGEGVNIGAGTITCNYDGVNKHKTLIEDNVFVGSNSQLVAPVVIKQGATIGAGTTVTHTVQAKQLIVTRAKARVVDEWDRPKKITK